MKRKQSDMSEAGTDSKQKSEIVALYSEYAKELDEINDRYERIIKCSRDTTINSKRLISLLQRLTDDTKDELLKKAEADLKRIHEHICKIASEVHQQDYYRYTRAFTFGIQEYVEAVSFYYFIKTGELISIKTIESMIKESHKDKLDFRITISDYMLGIADLTGEMMRLCINYASSNNKEYCFTICEFVRKILLGFETTSVYHYEYSKKLRL
eukprot:TRINITY_DN1922_c0_g1_i2.p1 TRINITY_DN1922_c0_g1~~TRINITY_DN1922_c0_g1_i2.p1  ORF type:complete len:212 (+),score=38.57 TRINITY_DN1922_c0_g1_i2:39-674(+)